VFFRSGVEAQFDANYSLLHISHFSMSVRSQYITNMTSQKCTHKKQIHIPEDRLADWFIKDTAIQQRTNVLQAELAQRSNFRDFCVASNITDYGRLNSHSSDFVILSFDLINFVMFP
jgi:hypothetical protein